MGDDAERRAALESAQTVGEALESARDWLRAAGASVTPELDAQVLLAHATDLGRALLIAFPERTLTPAQAVHYAALVARRAMGEPVAYLTGHREFMGLDLLSDGRALIPRPETELLVEAALGLVAERLARDVTHPPLAADIGTGSGAIAVALARLEPRLPLVYATDISPAALALAGENARRLGVADRVRLLQGDLCAPLPEPVDLLLANLPYVAPHDAATLAPDVRRYEPGLALYSDEMGLGHLRRFFAQAPSHLRPGGALLVEFGYDQRAAVAALAGAALPGYRVRVGADYAGWDRYAVVVPVTATP
jgi:release factor glutamine methyltransferase